MSKALRQVRGATERVPSARVESDLSWCPGGFVQVFEEILAFLVLGIGSGALISGVGLGVVLSYRGAGVINLGTGCIAMLSGFGYWALRTGYFGVTFSTVVSVIFTLIVAILLGLLFEFGLVRLLRRQTPLAKLVATLGFLLTAQATVILAFGEEARPQPSILPGSTVTVFGEAIPINRFWLFGILLVITLIFIGLYRWTKFGLGTRAASENEANATLFGLSPNRLSLINTVLMAVTMGIVGLLAASVQEVDSQTLPLLVVPALAAAMFGRFTSFGVTFVAGVLIGMAESLLTYLSTLSWFPTDGGPGNPLPGVQELMIFIILVVAMFFRAGRIPGRGDVIDRRLPPAPPPKTPLLNTVKWGLPAVLFMWLFPYGFREGLITSLISGVSLLSLVVIAGYVGQLSVVQLALGGVAGFTVSHFATNFGIGFPWAAIVGVIFAVIIGVVAGFPALRVRGVQLVVVTLAAAVAIENFGFTNVTWGAGNVGSPVPAPTLFGFNFGPNASFTGLDGGEPSPYFGWFVLIVLVVVALFVCNLRNSTLGQEMLAVRSNERAAAATGINVRNIKLIGFAIASGIAGISGVLLAYSYGSITSDSYSTLLALALIAFGFIIGITTVSGAIWAGIGLPGGLLAFALQDWFGLEGNWLNFAGGFLLVATLAHRPNGIAIYTFHGPPKPPFREGRIGRLIFRSSAPPPELQADGVISESPAGVAS
jgi:branched-chain amino acid transport system permease protein